MEIAIGTIESFWLGAFGPSSRLWPFFLIVTFAIGFGLYRKRHVKGSFLAWLMPRSMWTHASHMVDLKLFVFTRIISILGAFKVIAVGGLISVGVKGLFPAEGLGLAPLTPLVATLLIVAVGDFSTYWVHRTHHQNRILWPFHSLHHSAEVMTPVTMYRKHPLYDVSSVLARSSLVGVLQGILLGLFPQGVTITMLVGVNAAYFMFNLVGSNFRHMHIWLSFGPVLEHVFISPAQHQIHHSLAPAHHNKNYGEVLAIWDWMFGTLYVPKQAEILEFGLADAEGNRLAQRHDSLSAALAVPVQDSWRQIRKRLFQKAARDSHVTPAE